MKRILVLVMSCNDDFFTTQENIIKETWAKPILAGEYPNIDICFYRGTSNKHSYNKETHLLQVRCEDDTPNTFKKTYYALSLINNTKLFEYDYIFRTNTSTFVNVDLLNEFIQSLDNEKVVWTSELYSLSEANTPRPLNLYGRGNGLIISKKSVDVLLKYGLHLLYLEIVDDVAIGNIMNTYFINQGKNYEDYIKSYKHGWYKCASVQVNNNHQLCIYSNENSSFDFLKQFITIQIKRYHERDKENKNYYELQDIFSQSKDNNIKETVNDIYNYSLNPSIFIGSVIGYISYKQWKDIDKNRLYLNEISHKATDDAQRGNHKKVLY